jgi:hypothetical protein
MIEDSNLRKKLVENALMRAKADFDLKRAQHKFLKTVTITKRGM